MGWYSDLVSSGRAGLIWILLAFVVTFLVTRGITRRIRRQRLEEARAIAEGLVSAREERAGGGVIKDVEIGGVHIHHQVWGLLLMLVSGMLQFAFNPGTPWLEVTAIMFGAGAALVLDEFALWLHLDDVYWSSAGQKSVDAVFATIVVLVVLILGTGPLGITADTVEEAPIGVPIAIAMNLAFVVITLMKGKIVTAAIGFFLPLVALIGAIRLARVPSWWARRVYGTRPKRLARATDREEARRERIVRWRTRLGGAPDPEDDQTGA